MNINRNIYRSPETGGALTCKPESAAGDDVATGALVAPDGRRYPIRDGIPDFVVPDQLTREQADTLAYYDQASGIYDDVAHLSFTIQHCDEDATRKKFIDLLELKPSHRVLELACGTGRDSVNIAARLDQSGEFYVQDISRGMLEQCRKKLGHSRVPVEFSIGNACRLPFPDNHFDAVFSFGGLSVFDDIALSLKEMARVAKPGARIAVGDESLGPWLYDSEYGRILLNNNPLFKAELPLRHLPVEARDVRAQWLVGGVYYLIDFTVGEGEPKADFDLPIPGGRGGTLRTRYYGKLEGVKPETLALVREAREASGKSMHDWLESALTEAARKTLEDGKRG